MLHQVWRGAVHILGHGWAVMLQTIAARKRQGIFWKLLLGVAVAGCGHYGNVNDLSKLEILHWHDCGMYSTKFGMIPSISQFMDAAFR